MRTERTGGWAAWQPTLGQVSGLNLVTIAALGRTCTQSAAPILLPKSDIGSERTGNGVSELRPFWPARQVGEYPAARQGRTTDLPFSGNRATTP